MVHLRVLCTVEVVRVFGPASVYPCRDQYRFLTLDGRATGLVRVFSVVLCAGVAGDVVAIEDRAVA